MNWLCWHVGTVNDPKFGRIADKCKTPRANVIALWAMILESARDGRGAYSLVPEDAAYALGIEDQTVIDIHECLIERGLVDGFKVNKWADRQAQSNAERAREYRDRQKQLAEQTAQERTSPNVAEPQEVRQTEQTDTTDKQTGVVEVLNIDNNTTVPEREQIYAVADQVERIVAAQARPNFAFGLPSALEMLFREGHTELEILDAARVIAAQGTPVKTPKYLISTVQNRKADAARQSPRKPRYNPADASSPDAVAERRSGLAAGALKAFPRLGGTPDGNAGEGLAVGDSGEHLVSAPGGAGSPSRAA